MSSSPGVVHETLGEGAKQHEVALGHGDEGVAETVEPEAYAGSLADVYMIAVKAREIRVDQAAAGYTLRRWPRR